MSATTAPLNPDLQLFEADGAPFIFLANGSRIFAIDDEVVDALQTATEEGGAGIDDTLARFGLGASEFVTNDPMESVQPRALSLAVAQKCNLGCTYCYADEGTFGETPRNMPVDVAFAAVDALLHDAQRGVKYNVAFLGGEPLANRAVLRAAVARARYWSTVNGSIVTFSITTNGTLVRQEDIEFFAAEKFAVTVSLDGFGEVHDRQRPFKGGRGSFSRIVDRLPPLLAACGPQVSARVTVTPQNLELQETLAALLDMGFASVGFSPLLKSPRGIGEMDAEKLSHFLAEMIACGEVAEARLAAGGSYGFFNFMTALQEIHRGTHRPYPCGAGAGYIAASADGDFFACHRFVGDSIAEMGSVASGFDARRQTEWLAARHVHRQEPCRSCWARYLCGGSCHHEVFGRGRVACDYIRGWLQFCLQAYVRLCDRRPDLFSVHRANSTEKIGSRLVGSGV